MTIEWIDTKYWSEAALPEGTWRLKARDVVQIGFRPPLPDGDYQSAFDLVAAEKRFKKEFQQNRKRISYLHAMTGIGNEEIAYAESMIEARKLVEFIRAGSASLPSLEELVANAGLAHYQNPYVSPDKYTTYKRQIKSGTLDLTLYADGSVRGTFHGHGARCWHNLLSLSNDHPSYDKQVTVHVFYPEENPDLHRIGAAFIGWLITERMARERTRFSTPLGGKIKRQY